MIHVKNLKDSQIYNIISETKFGPSRNLKLCLNNFHAVFQLGSSLLLYKML